MKEGGLSRVPRSVWALGFVSLLMDVSSEMIHALLPLFLVSGLGASVAMVGLIEGVAEATASITKVFSGWLSDRLGKRKMLAVFGYALGALTKPIFPLAQTPLQVFGARFVDRIGKGIRGAPRDALIADVTPEGARGAAYGLRQSLDTVGSFAGPLLGMLLMGFYGGDIRAVYGWAVIPGMLAVILLILGVEEGAPAERREVRAPIRLGELRTLGRNYWGVVAVGVLFTLARFSEAFLVLRAVDAGVPAALSPAVLVTMNVVYSAVSAPVGSLSDRVGRARLLAAGFATLIVADVALALGTGWWGVISGVALWGLHMGLTQGILSALVADAAPARLRGTAFGVFHLASGVAMLVASALAGLLWTYVGPAATFWAGAVFAAVALLAGSRALPRVP